MSNTRHQQIKDIFFGAINLKAALRGDFLCEACQGDEELRREVDSLLRHDLEKDDEFADSGLAGIRVAMDEALGSSAVGMVSPAAGEVHSLAMPDTIGQYQIVRLVGEGGMGLVYEATQEHPRRTVALKIIRPGLSSEKLLRRFRLEAEVLGQLQHPGIAHIYDAGTADVPYAASGARKLPYFAMEFVQGETLDVFAKNKALSSRQRLALIAKTCEAVHHAHQKGVIHRDLKPANILIDREGQPKVLDFGVARMTDVDMRTATMHSAVGQLMGTVPYMSPEQVSGDSSQLDIRSDVYALGVISYELLAGSLPHNMRGRTLPDAVRAIRDEEPPRLSSINPMLRGDVETIVSKALTKDKELRYQSASELAGDIQRYLGNEPITARPASAIYQLRKFASRNKPVVAGVVAAFIALLAGVIASTLQARRAGRAEELARIRLEAALEATSLAEEREEEALRQTRISKAVNDFLNKDLLSAVDPTRTPDRKITVRQVLDQASNAIRDKFPDQPLVEAAVRLTLGSTYRNLGEYKEAKPHLLRGVELRTEHLGSDHRDSMDARAQLAWLVHKQGEHKQSESMHLQLLEDQRRVLGADDPSTLQTSTNLGVVYSDLGRYDEAERIQSDSLERLRRTLGTESSMTLQSMNNLAVVYVNQDRLEKASDMFGEVIELQREVLGEQNPTMLKTMMNLAYIREYSGKYAISEALYSEVLQGQRKVLGDEHPDTLLTMSNMAVLYESWRRPEQAEPLAREVVATRRKVLGDEHPFTITAMGNLANIYSLQERFDESEALFLETLDLQIRVVGEEDHGTLACMNNIALLYQKMGRYDDARKLQEKTLKIQKQFLGESHRHTLISMSNLARTLRDMGRLEEAAPLYADTISVAMASLEPDDRFFGGLRLHYGRCLKRMERFEEAEKEMLAGLDVVSDTYGEESERTSLAIGWIVSLYEAWDHPDEVQRWQARASDGDGS